MHSRDELEAELRALGASLDVPVPPPEQVARAVRARLEGRPGVVGEGLPHDRTEDRPGAARAGRPGESTGGSAEGRPEDRGEGHLDDRPDGHGEGRRARPGGTPARRGLRLSGRPRWQWATVVALVVAAIVGGTPQGRAAVVRILEFAGVELRIGEPRPVLPGAPSMLPGERRVSLDEARNLVVFPITVPGELGEPDEVRVSDGGRVVSLFWPGVRLDEYNGTLSVVFRKELGPPWPEEITVGASPGWWIPAQHGLEYVPFDGGSRVEFARLAGPTLIWRRDDVGLRLEGVADRSRAVRIASSVP